MSFTAYDLPSPVPFTWHTAGTPTSLLYSNWPSSPKNVQNNPTWPASPKQASPWPNSPATQPVSELSESEPLPLFEVDSEHSTDSGSTSEESPAVSPVQYRDSVIGPFNDSVQFVQTAHSNVTIHVPVFADNTPFTTDALTASPATQPSFTATHPTVVSQFTLDFTATGPALSKHAAPLSRPTLTLDVASVKPSRKRTREPVQQQLYDASFEPPTKLSPATQLSLTSSEPAPASAASYNDLSSLPASVIRSLPHSLQQEYHSAMSVLHSMPQARQHELLGKIKHQYAAAKRRNKLKDSVEVLKRYMPVQAQDKADQASIVANSVSYIDELHERIAKLERALTKSQASAPSTSSMIPRPFGIPSTADPSASLFNSILASLSGLQVMMTRMALDHTVLEVNSAFERITGYSREIVVGKRLMDLQIFGPCQDFEETVVSDDGSTAAKFAALPLEQQRQQYQRAAERDAAKFRPVTGLPTVPAHQFMAELQRMAAEAMGGQASDPNAVQDCSQYQALSVKFLASLPANHVVQSSKALTTAYQVRINVTVVTSLVRDVQGNPDYVLSLIVTGKQ